MNPPESNDALNIVGTMSGTSLDGLDLILCSFERKSQKWKYRVLKAVTIPYSSDWKRSLSEAHNLQAKDFIVLHNLYGTYIGNHIVKFLESTNEPAHIVASHGHTVFHQPEKKLTFQIGSGATIAAASGITTISDFRTLDMALGGQGAPLVPAGDELLFSEYRYCLNIGGFANISHNEGGMRIACDICPANIVANAIALKNGREYDHGGVMGKNGKIIPGLINDLNNLEYYSVPGPKSLGREWVDKYFMPVILRDKHNDGDILRSYYEHVSIQISQYLNGKQNGRVLITGGGVYNEFLIDLIKQKCKCPLVIPDNEIIEYKEALIFAFLGLLRFRNEINCLASVTGASADCSSGTIYRI